MLFVFIISILIVGDGYEECTNKRYNKRRKKRIIQEALDCNDSAGCENCSGCGLFGAGDPFEMYEDYIEGKREIKEINMEFVSRYFVRG